MTEPINILVVDDVEQNLVATEAILAQAGVNIIKAASGREALEVLLSHDIALALVDVQMPHMDGFELAELIRGSERTRAVPLIFLTAAEHEAKAMFRGYEAGAVDFLHKPIDEHILKSKVNVFIDLHAKEKQLSRQLEELRQALHMNELFTAVLGHDLRNPLSAILASAELIMMRPGEAQAQSAAARIRTSGDRMLKMINQLLDVVRIRSGGIDLQMVQTDYEGLCRPLIAELSAGGHRPGILLDAEGNTVGEADPDRLGQVLSNLLGNAVQHGDPGRPVRVRIDGLDGDQIHVEISNGGVVPVELREQIFQPFRSDHSDRHVRHNLGLGLYIVKQFVNAHGGQVTLHCEDESATVFRISMPRRRTMRNPAMRLC